MRQRGRTFRWVGELVFRNAGPANFRSAGGFGLKLGRSRGDTGAEHRWNSTEVGPNVPKLGTRPKSAHLARSRVRSSWGRIRPGFDQHVLGVGQIWLEIDKCRPRLELIRSDIASVWPEFGQTRPNLAPIRRNLAPEFGQSWPGSTKFGPKFTNFGQDWHDSDEVWPDQIWAIGGVGMM